ncbi:MAG TPA: PP2C family protein-serine/threonine phosphatase [Terriglobales bacterium]|nr:PP2C family protein-serine/threonine phosphatase [Terriglobales bacterium]
MPGVQSANFLPRIEIFAISLASIFLFVGLGAIALAAFRHRERMWIVTWFGVFSLLYGVRLFAESRSFLAMIPGPPSLIRYTIAAVTYTILIPALLFWYELSTPRLHRLVKAMIWAAVVVFVLGIGNLFLTGNTQRFMPLNNILAIVLILSTATINCIPRLARRYLTIQSPVLAIGTVTLAAAALYANLSTFIGYAVNGFVEPPAFAIFVFAIGYVAAKHVMTNERRLLSIEQELEVAREIQNSILPADTPKLNGLDIAAAYYPMASVAGDFYEFIQIDEHRAGFLIADVSGHGVPAALIASMIKVAMHAVQAHAADPGELLRGLNRILSHQLKGQFVTAGYLFVDMEAKLARYSGAGHPPLLHWNFANGGLRRLESNGLLFGVLKDTHYPSAELRLNAGDRFLLYTDGLTEPENSTGEQFGADRIVHVLRSAPARTCADVSRTLFHESKSWQPPNTPQQDDVTLIVLGVQ